MTPKEFVAALLPRLHEHYPNARYELDWETPFQLLTATILAAQCTDERVNKVTKVLFPRYPTPQDLADADLTELEEILKPTGAYRNKAKAVQATAKAIVERFQGEVPPKMESLCTLQGVARKTANVVLTNAFQIPSGIIVDTHVGRLAQRWGLSKWEKGEQIEQDLMRLVPKDEWIAYGPAVVLHGRYTCTAKKPQCSTCKLADLCPKLGVEDAV